MTTFADLGLAEDILAALKDVGYESPSPIQEQAIPVLLEGRDVIGQAQTGTGKTAAFGLPMIEFVDPDDPDVQALVLTPTRELCIQVTEFAPGERMVWSGGMPLGLFKGVRTFTLAADGAATRFTMREEYTGPMLPLIWRSMPDLQPSFDQFASGLKARAEAVAAPRAS